MKEESALFVNLPPKTMIDNFSRVVLERVIAKVCDTIGYSTTHLSALEVLTDVLIEQLITICKGAHRYSELGGRTEPSFCDFLMTFRDLGIETNELSKFITEVGAIRPPCQVPKYPVKKENHLNFLRPGSNEVILRPLYVHDHLPPQFPELEDKPIFDSMNKIQSKSLPPKRKHEFSNDKSCPTALKKPRLGSKCRNLSCLVMTKTGFLSSPYEGKLPDNKLSKTSEPVETLVSSSTLLAANGLIKKCKITARARLNRIDKNHNFHPSPKTEKPKVSDKAVKRKKEPTVKKSNSGSQLINGKLIRKDKKPAYSSSRQKLGKRDKIDKNQNLCPSVESEQQTENDKVSMKKLVKEVNRFNLESQSVLDRFIKKHNVKNSHQQKLDNMNQRDCLEGSSIEMDKSNGNDKIVRRKKEQIAKRPNSGSRTIDDGCIRKHKNTTTNSSLKKLLKSAKIDKKHTFLSSEKSETPGDCNEEAFNKIALNIKRPNMESQIIDDGFIRKYQKPACNFSQQKLRKPMGTAKMGNKHNNSSAEIEKSVEDDVIMKKIIQKVQTLNLDSESIVDGSVKKRSKISKNSSKQKPAKLDQNPVDTSLAKIVKPIENNEAVGKKKVQNVGNLNSGTKLLNDDLMRKCRIMADRYSKSRNSSQLEIAEINKNVDLSSLSAAEKKHSPENDKGIRKKIVKNVKKLNFGSQLIDDGLCSLVRLNPKLKHPKDLSSVGVRQEKRAPVSRSNTKKVLTVSQITSNLLKSYTQCKETRLNKSRKKKK